MKHPLRNAVGPFRAAVAAATVLLALFASPVSTAGATAGDGPTITVAIRYDDYSSYSQTDVDRKVIALLEKHQCPCTFAVVPESIPWIAEDRNIGRAVGEPGVRLTDEKVTMLKQFLGTGLVEVALHGLSHEDLSPDDPAILSEFEAVDAAEQLRRIREGKQVLTELLDCRMTTFIPPFNTYDVNTVSALEQTGFTFFSADTRGVPPAQSSLKFIPQTCHFNETRAAVESARAAGRPGALIVTIFHPQDLREAEQMPNPYGLGQFLDLGDVDSLLGWLKQQPDVQVLTLGQAGERLAPLDAARFTAWRKYLDCPALPMLPPALQRRPGYYPMPDAIRKLRTALWLDVCIYALVFVGLGLLSGAAAGFMVARLPRLFVIAGALGDILIGGGVAAVAVAARPYGWKDTAAICAGVGIVVSFATVLLLRRRTGTKAPEGAPAQQT